MTFISHAQNGEDVILWRALKHIEDGFYIDVGAWDPDTDSVTKAFYDRGWHGVNIEPVREYYELCVDKRPRDKNINVAVTARSGIARLMTVRGTGLSTTVHGHATEAVNKGWDVEATEVLSLSLGDLCATLAIREVHFLKIDVEGAERDVLEGADFEQFRPWIVIVEATEPLSTTRTEHLWEHILLQAGYQRAFFDGLNLYYLAQEHSELLPALAAPPNALDDFKLMRMVEAEETIAHLAAELAAHKNRLEEQDRDLEQKVREKEELGTLLEDFRLQYAALTVAMADQAKAHEVETARQAEAHALELRRQLNAAELDTARQAEAHALELAKQAETHAAELAQRDHAIADLQSHSAHQASSAAQRLSFTARNLAQSRRKILELEERLHALQHSLDSVAGLISLPSASHEPQFNVASALKAKLDDQARLIGELLQEHQRLAADQASLRRHRDDLLQSTSWRVSAPLRKVKTAFRIIRSEPHLVLQLVVENLSVSRAKTSVMLGTKTVTQAPSLIYQYSQPNPARPETSRSVRAPHSPTSDRQERIVAGLRYGIEQRRLLTK